MRDVQRALVLADLQFPQHNQKLLEVIVKKFIPRYRWDYLILLGDFMDMTAINHHAMESGNLRELEGRRLLKEYSGMATILRDLRAAVGSKCRIIYFMGNHEEWASKFIDKYPTLEGMLEAERNLPFDELNIETVKPRGLFKFGKAWFIHGDIHGTYSMPKWHAKNMLDIYHRNMVYGHHHTQQVYTSLSPAGINETHTAHAIPALCDINPDWAQSKPNQWLNGFAVVDASRKRFDVHTVVAVRNGFIFEGKEYE